MDQDTLVLPNPPWSPSRRAQIFQLWCATCSFARPFTERQVRSLYFRLHLLFMFQSFFPPRYLVVLWSIFSGSRFDFGVMIHLSSLQIYSLMFSPADCPPILLTVSRQVEACYLIADWGSSVHQCSLTFLLLVGQDCRRIRVLYILHRFSACTIIKVYRS